MRNTWKRNLVLTTMVVLVGTAVFLNWKYTNRSAQAGTKILGESTLVSGSSDSAGAAKKASGSAAAVDEEGVYTGSDYFASARLTRQQARDNAIELLQKAAKESGASQSAADEASAGIQALASYTMKEAQIENLVTAKGYKDCVAFMGKDSISVVVSKDGDKLTDSDVAKIKDITVTETGYPASSVKIMKAN